MKQLFSADREYKSWVKGLKQKIRSAQIKAALSVNTEMLNFYWELGTDIVEKQKVAKWGDGFLARLSDDLMNEFPGMKGFSLRNIKYIRQWFLFYSTQDLIGQQAVAQIMQQVVAQLSRIPWGHNITIISKCKNVDEALFYVSAIDGILKTEKDDPTIGILICKSKNNTVVEYTIKDINKPIGVSRYNIVSNLEEKIKSSLPTIEEIEVELSEK